MEKFTYTVAAESGKFGSLGAFALLSDALAEAEFLLVEHAQPVEIRVHRGPGRLIVHADGEPIAIIG